jgi:ABC-type amino acid transport substrate-binding protein
MAIQIKLVGSVAVALALVGSAHAADDLLQQVKARGVLRVCQISYMPFNVKDPMTNEWSGINVDVVKAIAADLKVKIEDVDATFSTMIPSLQSNKCDISAGATYITPERAKQALFSVPDAEDSKTAVVPKNSTAKTLAELDKAGTVISVRAASGEETLARSVFKNATVRPTTSDAAQPHLMEVATGRADAAIAGYTGAYVFAARNPNLSIKMLDNIKLEPTPFALMMPLGEVRFKAAVDSVIERLQKSGELATIVNRYMPKQAGN